MATQNPNIPPSNNDYAGDEVSAIVLDPGYNTIRAGFAGEDTPKSVTPTFYGALGDRTLFGENSIHTPLPNLEIRNPYNSEGIVEDWDTAARLWEYAITSRLTSPRATHPSRNGLNEQGNEDVEMEGVEGMEKPLEDSPLLMTEPSWNPAKARERMIEIAMEDWGAPAFWLGKTGVMAAFAQGKATALVVDVGAATTSITPVVDGIHLKKGSMKTTLAGNFISDQIRLCFAQSQPPVPLTPHYMVASKVPVDAGAPSQAKLRTFANPPADSFRRFEEERVLTEFKESVVQIWPGPGRLSSGNGGGTNEDAIKGGPGRPFEMPDGWNQVFSVERYKVAEGLFDAKSAFFDDAHPQPASASTLPDLIFSSLSTVDVEIRPQMVQNIVLTGGTSLTQGLADRLQAEIATRYPSLKAKVAAPGNVVERKFASWIGGSILASLGSFHQMWVSRKEYEEHGAAVVEKRCK